MTRRELQRNNVEMIVGEGQFVHVADGALDLETFRGSSLLADGLHGQLDMAFIDADKGNYDNYYERCLELVRPGGLILVDNVLWLGQVSDPANNDADTMAIRVLNKKLQADRRVDLTLFAVGDGMTCALKR